MTLDAISARTGAAGLSGEFYGQINRCQSDSTAVKFSTNRPKADSWLMEAGFQKNEVLHSKVEAAHPSRDLQRLPEWGLWRGSGPASWFLSILCFLGFSAGLEAQVDLPSSFYDTTVYWSSGVVRFNQVGSNRVEGAASSTALTWTQEEDSIPGMSAGFSVSTKNIDVESPTIDIACGRYFYIESQSQQPVTVQMTVKGNLHIDYMAALKPDRNMEHGYFCGFMRGRISGESVVGGELSSGFRMEKVGVDLPKLETYMGPSKSGQPYEYNITNSINITTNILVGPNRECFVLMNILLSHYRNNRYPDAWEYQQFFNSGDLRLELAIDPTDTSNSRIIMGIARPDLSFEFKADRMTLKYTGVLQAADTLDGPFVDVPNAQSPYTETIGSGRLFRARF